MSSSFVGASTDFLILIAIIIVLGSAAYAGFSAAPWVPTRRRDLKRFFELAALREGETIFDLGAGDGLLVVQAAKRFGVHAVGVELSIIMYCIAKLRSWVYRGPGSVTIRYGNFYRTDLTSADAIVCFLTPMAMRRLGPKLWQELKPGARVVSYAFRIPGGPQEIKSKPSQTDTPIWLYRQPGGVEPAPLVKAVNVNIR